VTWTCVRPLVPSFSSHPTHPRPPRRRLGASLSVPPRVSLHRTTPLAPFFLRRTRDARLFIVLYTRRASFAAIARAHRPRDYLVRASMRTFFLR